jgi:hypothetical protein
MRTFQPSIIQNLFKTEQHVNTLDSRKGILFAITRIEEQLQKINLGSNLKDKSQFTIDVTFDQRERPDRSDIGHIEAYLNHDLYSSNDIYVGTSTNMNYSANSTILSVNLIVKNSLYPWCKNLNIYKWLPTELYPERYRWHFIHTFFRNIFSSNSLKNQINIFLKNQPEAYLKLCQEQSAYILHEISEKMTHLHQSTGQSVAIQLKDTPTKQELDAASFILNNQYKLNVWLKLENNTLTIISKALF